MSPEQAIRESLTTKITELKNALLETANQLDDWAEQSRTGGWSTHQVEPMRKKADELRRIAR